MTIPWRTVTARGANRTNADNAESSGGTPDATNPTPATTANESSSSNISVNAPQVQPPRQRPTIVADILRISVDMVIDGRPRRRVNLGPINPAPPQPANENSIPSQNSPLEQTTNDDTNGDDFDDEPPALVSLEESEQQDRRFGEFLDRIGHNRHSLASDNENAFTPPNESPERIVHPNPPVEPDPQPVHEQFIRPVNVHVAGTGRSIEEAFNQAFARLRQMTQSQPRDGDPVAADGSAPPTSQQTQAEPQGQGQTPWQLQFMDFAIPMRPPHPEGPKRPWAPPPPPGPTLRQRVERREQEAGLRCHDVSCGLGPSDEYPLGDDINDALHRGQQLSIVNIVRDEDVGKPVCEHMFHGECLVSAERVALRGAEAVSNAVGVEVSCPVCRASGCVSKEQWDAGVLSLQ